MSVILVKGDFYMFIVGVDIAKRAHEAMVIDSSGTVIQKSFSFKNTTQGFDKHSRIS